MILLHLRAESLGGCQTLVELGFGIWDLGFSGTLRFLPDHIFMAETAVAAAERTLPHNLEAERSVLGAILVHNDAFNLAAQVIDAGDFYRDAHRRIFDKMVALNERNQAIDFVTLKEELSRGGELDDVGGPGLRRVARRRRAARDQRRVLRAHRQGKGDAAEPDLRGEQDPDQRLRGGPGVGPDPGRGRERDLRGGRRPAEGRASCRCATW